MQEKACLFLSLVLSRAALGRGRGVGLTHIHFFGASLRLHTLNAWQRLCSGTVRIVSPGPLIRPQNLA